MRDASSRQSYVVTYDICDPKRLRRVYETLRGHGDHLQLSVFRCDLTRRELEPRSRTRHGAHALEYMATDGARGAQRGLDLNHRAIELRESKGEVLVVSKSLLFEHADYPRDPAFGSYSEVPGNRLVRRPVTIRFDVTSNEIQNLALPSSLCVHNLEL